LVPIDFSQPNHLANEYASELAMANHAQLIYLHAIGDEKKWVAHSPAHQVTPDLQHLRSIQPSFANVKASHIIEYGSPGETIVEFAKKNDIDLIVMGTHGRTGLSRVLMGGVAEQVVQRAPCPVMTINLNHSRKS